MACHVVACHETDQPIRMSRRRQASLEETFGTILRSLREREPGLSQERLGLDISSGRTYVSEMERGQRNPSLKMLFRLARRLGVRPSDLVRRLEDALGPLDRLNLD